VKEARRSRVWAPLLENNGHLECGSVCEEQPTTSDLLISEYGQMCGDKSDQRYMQGLDHVGL